MSADLLCQTVLRRLRAERESAVTRLRLCKPRSAIIQGGQAGSGIAVIPPAQCEEIALFAVDINAKVDTLDNAILILQEEFRKLTSPEEKPADVETEKGKEFY